MQGTRCRVLASGLAVIDVEVAETAASFLAHYLFGLGEISRDMALVIVVVTNYSGVIFLLETTWRISSDWRGTTCSWIFPGIILLFLLLATAEFFDTPKFFPFSPISLISLLRSWAWWLGFLLSGVFYMTLALSLLLLMLDNSQAGAVVPRTVLIYFLYLWSRPTPSLFFSGCGFPD